MKFYIPAVLLNCFPGKEKQYYFYIISKLNEAKVINKMNYTGGFIPLKMEYLRNVIGRRKAKPVIEDLKLSGIIETDNHYITGSKAIGYKLNDRYRNEQVITIPVTDRKFEKRLSKLKQNKENIIPEKHHYRRLFYDLKQTRIDNEKALKYLNENFERETDKYNLHFISIDKLNSGDYYFIKNYECGRIFTNITNLKKELRNFLHFRNKTLFELDIANSQPFFFNNLIYYHILQSTEFLSYDGHFHLKYSEIRKILIEKRGYKLLNEIELYKDLTESGKFYDYLIDKMNYTGSRKEFKINLFKKIFYCENKENYIYDEIKKFEDVFPCIMQIIKHYKKEDYRNLAIQLQRTEAEFIIDNVCKKLYIKYPKIFLLTIHDSILTTEEYLQPVKEAIENEFFSKFELKPKVKIK